jgi:hypothetical protein
MNRDHAAVGSGVRAIRCAARARISESTGELGWKPSTLATNACMRFWLASASPRRETTSGGIAGVYVGPLPPRLTCTTPPSGTRTAIRLGGGSLP